MVKNFGFIPETEEWSKLRDLVKKAEENVHHDPDTTCVKGRKALEFVVKYIHSEELESNIDRELFVLLKDKAFERWIGEKGKGPLQDLFHKIRLVGNDGAHVGSLYEADVNTEEAIDILKATHEMVWWFMKRNAPAHTYQDSPDFEVPEENESLPSAESSTRRAEGGKELQERSTSDLIHLVKTEESDSGDVEIATGILLNRIKEANDELFGFLS